jgi:O-antigen ligase
LIGSSSARFERNGPAPRRYSTRRRFFIHGSEAWLGRLQAWLTGSVLVLSIFLGGGAAPGLFPDAILQIASLPLLGVATVSLVRKPLPDRATFPLLLIGAIILVIALQLVPLPPSIWAALPGRGEFAATYDEAGIAVPWLPISLDPGATWLSGMSLLPGLAVFLSMLQLPSERRRQLCWLLVALGFVSALLGLAQVMQGPDSALRPFGHRGNTGVAVGFFASRNQYVALLYGVMPFTAALCAALVLERRARPGIAAAIGVSIYVVLTLGLTAALSRAGLLLGFAAGVGSVAILAVSRAVEFRSRASRSVSLGAILIAVTIQATLLVALERRESLEDSGRAEIHNVTLKAASAFAPLGSGLGTFVPVYAMAEEPETVSTSYTNRAHNDWLELWLEAGVPAAALGALFLVWLGIRAWAVWSTKRDERSLVDALLARAATVTIVLVLLHSAADYPLRTGANLTVFALACALLVPSSGGGRRGARLPGQPADSIRGRR